MRALLTVALGVVLLEAGAMAVPTDGLLGHWPLAGDCRDHSGNGHDGLNYGADLDAGGPGGSVAGGAAFDGREAFIAVPDARGLQVGDGDFTVAAWLRTDADMTDVIGDLVSKYDPSARRGLNLSVINHAGMTSSQSSYRTLFFGVDDARATAWEDCGRPGEAVLIGSMCVFDGDLYVGTCEPYGEQMGRVYRWRGEGQWEDLGSPDGANTVMAMAAHGGALYVGTAAYNTRGSLLPAAENTTPGGHVYRYAGGHTWVDCGQMPESGATYCLASYGGGLYGIAMYVPGVFRWDGEQGWEYCGTPGEQRSMALAVHNGSLWVSGNGSAGVHRYLGGEAWEFCGRQGENTQTYSFAIHEGRMYVGTWPDGSVHRYEGGERWANVGRMGEEKEVMGLAIYNGKMYGGTLPLGQVYRFDGPGQWALTGQLDTTPDVTYRRVWTMAVHGGWLYAGTLPSGRVYRMMAGSALSHDAVLPAGWHHIAAVRDHGALHLYLDGERVARSERGNRADFSIDTNAPLRLGFGQHDYLNGSLADVRLYGRALGGREIAELMALAKD